MKDYKTANLRNVGILGHGGSGKTSIAEAMLYNTGVLDRFGKVDDGTTTTDYDPEEIKRKVSISASMAPCEWKEKRINVIDTPGYFDFVGEVYSALQVVDSVVIMVDAVGGVEVGAEKAWDYINDKHKAACIFVNKLDRENASFDKTLTQLREMFGNKVVPISIPIGSETNLKGVVDILDMKAFYKEGNKEVEGEIPADLMDKISEYHDMIAEAAAQADEELMEKYFAGEELTIEELEKGVHLGVVAGDVVPVFCGSATKNLGITLLMDMISHVMESPDEGFPIPGKDTKKNEEVKVQVEPSGAFSAQVFKTIADPFVGKISMFKVITGVAKNDMEVSNPGKDKKEKLSHMFLMRGKKQIPMDMVVAGEIACVAKLQFTTTGDTLCDGNCSVIYDKVEYPEPCISMAIEPKSKGDEDKIGNGLARLVEEDPTIRVEKNIETKQTVVSGLGDQHLEIVTKKLQSKFGVEVVLSVPKIAYRETIKKKARAEGKHKKQSGGHGQFGHVWIEFEPVPDGGKDFEFVDKVVGGVVPRQYIPAVEKGLLECLSEGVLAGFPVVRIKASLVDGSFHPVDSAEMPFKIAAHMAFNKGVAEAGPVLLEPINHVEIYVPESYMGDIIGDLNKKRGRILGMEKVGRYQRVTAEAPLAEMFKYATDLRSITQARGYFTMKFAKYEEVPGPIAAKVIEVTNAKREKEKAEH